VKRIKPGFILPSVTLSIALKQVKYYQVLDKPPEIGDVVYGVVERIGEHSTLENKSGRIHIIHNGTEAIFVFGNRYAPDYYEGLLPGEMMEEADLLARSGMIGQVKTKKANRKDPTKIKLLGYVCDSQGQVLNTRNFPMVMPKNSIKKTPRARLILVCGTSMNSGKSMAAAACCWALSSLGHKVKAAKVTGTASLKDILHMNDAGARTFADFTHLGFPSTYMLSSEEVLHIFNSLDLIYAYNPRIFWVVEFADGINHRETAMLLASPEVTSRIDKLIFCAGDAFGAIGGLNLLKERFGLIPDALSGVCSSSPLHIRELSEFTNIPVFNSLDVDTKELADILLPKKRRKGVKRPQASSLTAPTFMMKN
jgi:hypothetical protein